jgi:hypothetical protein
MGAAEVLGQNGILRPAEVVDLANGARLEIACAAVLLVKESGGGRNVWGSDGVQTGGTYVKGGTVDQGSYQRYKAWRQAGPNRMQGVGPTQITYYTIQDQADARGGCWDWRVNCAVGFDLLAGHIRAKGVQDGFRAYNGSGAAAENYGRDAMAKLATWRPRLAGQPSAPPPPAGVTGADALPSLVYGMMNNPAVASLQRFLNAFNWTPDLPLLPATGNYLDQTVGVLRSAQAQMGVQGGDGRNVGSQTKAALWARGFRG